MQFKLLFGEFNLCKTNLTPLPRLELAFLISEEFWAPALSTWLQVNVNVEIFMLSLLWNLAASHRKLMNYNPRLSLRVAWHIGVWLIYIWLIITVMNAKQRKVTHGQIQGSYEWQELGWQLSACITAAVGFWKFYALNFGWIGCTFFRKMYFEIPTLIFLKNVVRDKI